MSIKCSTARLETLVKMCSNWQKKVYVCFLEYKSSSFEFYEKWKDASLKRNDVCWAHINCDKHPEVKSIYSVAQCPSICIIYPNGAKKFVNVEKIAKYTDVKSVKFDLSEGSKSSTASDDDLSIVRNQSIRSREEFEKVKSTGGIVMFTNAKHNMKHWNEAVLRSKNPSNWYVLNVDNLPMSDVTVPSIVKFHDGKASHYPHPLEDDAKIVSEWFGESDTEAMAIGNAQVKSTGDIEKLNSKVDNVVVLYYADWCGHCKSLKDIWNSVVCNNIDDTSSAWCAVEQSNGEAIMRNEGIQGFPTIRKYAKGNSVDFEGDRNESSLLHFSLS